MSEGTEDRYAEITADMERSARAVWQEVRTEATKTASAVRGEVREGAAGYLWDGALLGVFERLWPQLSGAGRGDVIANQVRQSLHRFLTRNGLLHCDDRGSARSTAKRLPQWWVSAEYDPQPGVSRARPGTRKAEPQDGETVQEEHSGSEHSFEAVVSQVWQILQAAVIAGAPLTATTLAQIPTGVAADVRRMALDELVSSGVVWVESWGFSSRPIPVYLCDPYREGTPAIDVATLVGADRRDAADVLAEFLEDYRRKEEQLAEVTARLETINTALGR